MRYGYIYIIQNLLNDKKYVGLTLNPKLRWSIHKGSLRRGNHSNKYLQNAYNKYGEENFKFDIYLKCKASEIEKEEIKIIKLFQSYYKNRGYNLTKGGKGGDLRPIDQYDRKGTYLKSFDSIIEASNEINVHSTLIWRCCNNKQTTTRNFQWCYFGQNDKIKSFCKLPSIVKPVYQYMIDGKFVAEFSTAIQAAKICEPNKIFKSTAINIRKCCQGSLIITYGFQWRFKKKKFIRAIDLKKYNASKFNGILNNRAICGNKVGQYTLDGKLIKIYERVGKIKEEWGNKIHAIEQVLQGLQLTSQGFLWKYFDKNGNVIKSIHRKRKYRFKNGKKIIIKRHRTT